MTMHTYYMSWRTWQTETIQTPWDFWFLSEGTTYKPRHKNAKQISVQDITDAFESSNQEFLEQLSQDYVCDVKLVAFIPGETETQAQQLVLSLFPDAEFDKTVPVDAHTQQQITQLFMKTLTQSSS